MEEMPLATPWEWLVRGHEENQKTLVSDTKREACLMEEMLLKDQVREREEQSVRLGTRRSLATLQSSLGTVVRVGIRQRGQTGRQAVQTSKECGWKTEKGVNVAPREFCFSRYVYLNVVQSIWPPKETTWLMVYHSNAVSSRKRFGTGMKDTVLDWPWGKFSCMLSRYW